MATFDGELHLAAQLRSLQAQTHSHWRLLVRDDGSKDGTLEILRRFVAEDDRIRLVEDAEGRLGASAGFAHLLQLPGLEDAVLCADQDDVWHPRKIERLLAALDEAKRRAGPPPLLVCSDALPVDGDLRVLAPSFWDWSGLRPPTPSWRWLLVYSYLPGCTMLTTCALRRSALPFPHEALGHDTWLALVAAYHRGLVTLPDSLMLYRRHGATHTRLDQRDVRAYLRRIFTAPLEVLAGRTPVGRQARAFARRYGAGLRLSDLWVRKLRITWRKLRARRRHRGGSWTTPEAEAVRREALEALLAPPAVGKHPRSECAGISPMGRSGVAPGRVGRA